MNTINICGSFGYGNAGDEAIPLAIADMLGALGIHSEINVLGRFDEPDLPSVIGLGKSDRERRNQIMGLPTIVSGGGVVENNAGSTVLRCSNFLRLVPLDKLGFIGVSVEAGVQYGWFVRKKIQRVLTRCDCIYTRDIVSEAVIRNNFSGQRVETIGDLVLWMKPSSAVAVKKFDLPKSYIAVILAPRWSKNSEWRKWIVNELFNIQRQFDVDLVFVPMSCRFDDDRVEHRSVADLLRARNGNKQVIEIAEELSPRDVSAILSGSLLTISMRLHGCVMAYSQKRPFVALSYHPKVSAFCATIAADHCVLPAALPAAQTVGSYGYDFGVLAIYDGDLVDKVSESLRSFSFEKLDDLKKRSLVALKSYLAKAHVV